MDYSGEITKLKRAVFGNDHAVTMVESGTDGYWTWYKYSDGSFDMYRHTTATIASYWSSSPLNGFSADFSFPAGCQPKDTDYSVFSTWKIGTGFGIGADTGSKTTSGFRTYGLGTASGSQSCIIDLYVHGKYK